MRVRSLNGKGLYLRGGKVHTHTLQWVKDYYQITGEPCVGVFDRMGTSVAAVLDTTLKDTSVIIDVPHGRGSSNPCTHVKLTYGNGEYNAITTYDTPGVLSSTYTWEKNRRLAPPNASGVILLANTQLSDALRTQRAWRDLQPQFKNRTGFSGINSLIELRELKSAPKQILRLSRGIVAAARNVFRHESHKTLAELHLANAYAFQPLVKDASALSVTLQQSAGALARFNKQGETWNTFHYKEDLPMEKLQSSWASGVRDYTERRGVYRASVPCRWKETSTDAIGTFLVYHGLTLSPAQIWEALPFSFLVDQVLTVGKTLERLSRTPVSHQDVGQFTESIKRTSVTVRCVLKGTSLRYFSGGCDPQSVDVGPHHPISFAMRDEYLRYPSLPPALGGVPLPQIKLPGLSNLVNDLALLRTGVGWRNDPRTLFNGPKG